VTAVRWCDPCSGGRARPDRARAEGQGLTWGDEGDERLKLVLARWTIAMVYALQAHLRRGYDLRAALSVRAPACAEHKMISERSSCRAGRACSRACHDVMCSFHQAPSFKVPSFLSNHACGGRAPYCAIDYHEQRDCSYQRLRHMEHASPKHGSSTA